MYHYEKETGDIVIDGWESGIAFSPHKGLGNIQCANIKTIPGEIMCNYGRTLESQINIPSGTFSGNAGGASGVVTYNGATPLLHGSIVNVTGSTISGFSNQDYYVLSVSGTSVTFAGTYEGAVLTGFGTSGSAAFSTYAMGKGISKTSDFQQTFPDYEYFVLDSNGYVWRRSFKDTDQTWKCINVTNLKTKSTGIAVYGNYLLLATQAELWFKALSALGTGWAHFDIDGAGTHALFSGNDYTHFSLLGHDNILYFTDQNTIASLVVTSGSNTTAFIPTTNTTYTWNSIGNGSTQALTFPQTEIAYTMAELGTNLAIGTLSNNLYFWNRTPIVLSGANGSMLNSFFYPVILPESWAQTLVTVNNLLYVFCGIRGNCYVTNGTTISSVFRLPDSVTQQIEPYYLWGDAIYLRGRIFFSVQDSNSKTGGIWSFIPTQSYYIEQDIGYCLRLDAQNTSNTYAGMATLLFAPSENGVTNENGTQDPGQKARGPQFWAAWWDGSTTYGIDYSSTSPFTGGQTIIETDVIPTGTMLNKASFSQLEYKLAAPLVAGESVVIKWRTDLTSSYSGAGTLVTEPSTADGSGTIISGYYSVNFQNSQWLQLQVILTSVVIGSSPSFVRLVQLRVR